MPDKKTKFIVIAGSIMSGLGKGIVTSSIAKLLAVRGYKVVPIKFDGYLNVDCGTMNPLRHGEVFVLEDGTEVDMDFGTYERFLNTSLPGICSITGGKLFQKIIEKERKGDYLGRDVQFVPHLTDEIKNWVKNVGTQTNADVVMVEIGGTIGDMENSYFVEAMRQMYFERHDMIFVQLTYVPSLSPGEQKTKPAQQSTRLLQSLGIQPNMILVREQEKLNEEAKKKISQYCNVPEEAVFDDPVVSTVYELPLHLEKEGIYKQIAKILGLDPGREPDLKEWQRRVKNITDPKDSALKIAVVGKYTAVKDAYISVREALVHSAAAINSKLEISWVESTELEKTDNVSSMLKQYHGILVPGGFGVRGIEGKLNAIRYARENKVPYLGLCLGMQLMVIEYARNVCGMKGANSTEFDKKTEYPVVDILPGQHSVTRMGGTLRLGTYECPVTKGTVVNKAYGSDRVSERYRHRYEVNPKYIDQIAAKGLVVSGIHLKENLVSMTEWKDGFGVATQAHIELTSKLETPGPLFVEFMKAAKKRLEK